MSKELEHALDHLEFCASSQSRPFRKEIGVIRDALKRIAELEAERVPDYIFWAVDAYYNDNNTIMHVPTKRKLKAWLDTYRKGIK